MIPTEATLRLTTFFAVFAAMALLELVRPEANLRTPRTTRWPRNLAIALINMIVVRAVFPAGAVAAAIWATERGWGLLNRVGFPEVVEVVAAMIVLDLVVYVQHVVFHFVPLLFRFHSMHHADLDFDVTLATRFHPVEMLVSMVIKCGGVIAVGASPLAVLVFELLLNATSVFNHGNVRLPTALDRLVRLFVVTPAMHRIHHSYRPSETNSNFGFNLPWWDHLFGTYRRASNDPEITIGLPEIQAEANQSVVWMLRLPLRGPSINV